MCCQQPTIQNTNALRSGKLYVFCFGVCFDGVQRPVPSLRRTLFFLAPTHTYIVGIWGVGGNLSNGTSFTGDVEFLFPSRTVSLGFSPKKTETTHPKGKKTSVRSLSVRKKIVYFPTFLTRTIFAHARMSLSKLAGSGMHPGDVRKSTEESNVVVVSSAPQRHPPRSDDPGHGKDIKGCGSRTPHYVTGSVFVVLDGPERPVLSGYPDIPLCYCPERCGGFRFQMEAISKCCGRSTCFYQRTVHLNNLTNRSRYVDRCSYCSKTYVRTSIRQAGMPDTCGAVECDVGWCSEYAGTCACVVCDRPCGTQISVTTGILPHLYPSALFVSDQFWACPGACQRALKKAAVEEVCAIGRRLVEPDPYVGDPIMMDVSRVGVTSEIKNAILSWIKKIPM